MAMKVSAGAVFLATAFGSSQSDALFLWGDGPKPKGVVINIANLIKC